MNSRCYSLFFTATAFCYSLTSLQVISAAAPYVVVLFFLSPLLGLAAGRGYIKVQVMLDFCLFKKK
jgi:hypothetical protein